MKSGAQLIAEEREAHKTREGWTDEGDSQYKIGALALAGINYATFAVSSPELRDTLKDKVPAHWPWRDEWWKPGPDNSVQSRVRELVKAGSLIAAEIDRMQANDNYDRKPS